MKREDGKHRKDKIVISDQQINEIETMSGYGLSRDQILRVLGISEMTYYRRAAEDPRITDAMERGRAKAETVISQKAYQMARDGHADMIKFWLKCRARWKETTEHKVEISGEAKVTHQLNHIANMTEKELEAHLEKIKSVKKAEVKALRACQAK